MKPELMNSRGVYEGLRKMFLLGLRVRPILDALQLRPDEKILDVGCGYGIFVKYCQNCDYTGMDVSPERIGWAQKTIGENDRRRFATAEAQKIPFPSKSFDLALGYGLLHHLSDEDAQKAVKELARVVRGRVVFSDPVYSKYHWINNLLCRMDQGPFVRTREQYLDLCAPSFNIRKEKFFYARNGLAKYFLITATPKELA